MAKTPFKNVVYFEKPGSGVLPGIVLQSQLNQLPDGSLSEKLSLLYAHPKDEDKAAHHAMDIGDVEYSVFPLSKRNPRGWSETEDRTLPEEAPVEEVDASAPPLPVETKQYSDGTSATGTAPLPDKSPAQQEAEEVFTDPDGRTIGRPDGNGGYVDHRLNPLPPPPGQDWTGKPITT